MGGMLRHNGEAVGRGPSARTMPQRTAGCMVKLLNRYMVGSFPGGVRNRFLSRRAGQLIRIYSHLSRFNCIRPYFLRGAGAGSGEHMEIAAIDPFLLPSVMKPSCYRESQRHLYIRPFLYFVRLLRVPVCPLPIGRLAFPGTLKRQMGQVGRKGQLLAREFGFAGDCGGKTETASIRHSNISSLQFRLQVLAG